MPAMLLVQSDVATFEPTIRGRDLCASKLLKVEGAKRMFSSRFLESVGGF